MATANPNTRFLLRCSVVLLSAIVAGAAAHAGDGELDPSFAGNGKAVVGFADSNGPQTASAYAAVMRADGRILTGGSWTTSVPASRNLGSLAQLTPDGGLDTAFGIAGIVSTVLPLDTDQNTYVNGLAVQPDARILAVGSYGNRGFITRLSATGQPDSSFGNQGRVFYPLAGTPEVVLGAALTLPSGRIFVTGSFFAIGNPTEGLLNLLLDANGNVLTAQLVSDAPMTQFDGDIATQDDGKILVAATAAPDCAIVRVIVGTGLSLDADFGTGGVVHLDWALGGGGNYCNAIALQRDGKILVGGDALTAGNANRAMVTRLLPNGSIDAGFGKKAFYYASSADNLANTTHKILVQNDGHIVLTGVAGTADPAAVRDFGALRLFADGSLDASFTAATPHSSPGKVVFGFETTPTPSQDFCNTALLQNDRIVIVGQRQRSDTGQYQFAVARLQNDGIFANGFGP
jgi:uncharacterized delta-60 repeat protein